MTPQFHPLRVAEVRGETADTISVRFDVPDDLRDAYRFTQGQFLTLRVPCGSLCRTTWVWGTAFRRAFS